MSDAGSVGLDEPATGRTPIGVVRPAAAAGLDEDQVVESDLDGALPAADDAGRPVGLRTELRSKLRSQDRVKLAALISAIVVLLGALPAILLLRTTSSDPVFSTLDSLAVPKWAAGAPADTVSGSRWCVIECRFRERDLTSQRGTDETAAAYQSALLGSGWARWKVAQCPDGPVDGKYTCWQRDEFTMDLWVRPPPCASNAVQGQTAASPSAGASTGTCTGSVVSIKVRNRIDDERGRGPEPSKDAKLTGETPDPAFTDNPFPTTPGSTN
jgi:hypothetical protein